jgi:hypothetical protein
MEHRIAQSVIERSTESLGDRRLRTTTTGSPMEQPSTGDAGEKPDVFKVWKKYEDIAMHFNDPLIKLRTQALGGIAVISALVGLLSKGDTPEDFRWGIMVAVFFLLSFFWVALWILDSRYYNRLLEGAVYAILEIEKTSDHSDRVNHLNMSRRIEQAVRGELPEMEGGGRPKTLFRRCRDELASAKGQFYLVVLLALVVGLGGACTKYYFSHEKQSLIPINTRNSNSL